MKIYYFCPLWGSEHMEWEELCSKVKAAGYHGIEGTIPFDESEKTKIAEALDRNELKFIGQYFQSFEKEFQVHKDNYEKHLWNLVSMKPFHIDAQTGKDYFTIQQNSELFKIASEISDKSGITISHETHRNKALFAAHVTKELLKSNPDITITADFSHWCNVAESLLEDQEEAVTFACQRAVHIHARVGHAQGPQITDPRLPEWKNEVEVFLGWWDAIISHRATSGSQWMTISPEFGPQPYMSSVPYTNQPIASQWEINRYMLQLLKQRYGKY
jgi:sugar phosphate isomerase/epimerase